MAGRVCVVTGANSGIGKATAMGLAEMGATVILVCRSKEKGDAALSEIRGKSGNNSLDLMLADMSSMRSVRQLASEFRESTTGCTYSSTTQDSSCSRERLLETDSKPPSKSTTFLT